MDNTISPDYMPVGYGTTNFIYNSYPDAMQICSNLTPEMGSIQSKATLSLGANFTLNDQLCYNNTLANQLESTYTRHSGTDERFLNTKSKYSKRTMSAITITLGIIQTIIISRFIL